MEIGKKLRHYFSERGWIIAIAIFLVIPFIVRLFPGPFDVTFSIFLSFVASIALIRYTLSHFRKFIKKEKYLVTIGYYVALMLSIALFFSFVFSAAAFFTDNCVKFGQCGTGTCENQVTGLNLIYYNAVTLSTLGFGDACPEGILFRFISVVEAFVGLFINVVLIAMIIKKNN